MESRVRRCLDSPMAGNDGAPRIRVLVAGVPPIPEEFVAGALAPHGDIELIKWSGKPQEALAVIAEWCPDVVIIPVPVDQPGAAYHAAMRRYPLVRLLEIGERPADVYEVRLLAVNPGGEAVAEAIRKVAGRQG